MESTVSSLFNNQKNMGRIGFLVTRAALRRASLSPARFFDLKGNYHGNYGKRTTGARIVHSGQ